MKKVFFLAGLLAIMMSCNEDDTFEENKVEEEALNSTHTELAFPNRLGPLKKGFFEGMEITYEIIDGEYVLGGDVILPKELVYDSEDDFFKSQINRKTNMKSVGLTTNRWPENTVYYKIDEDLPESSRVTEAIDHWKEKTNLVFKEKQTSTKNYIYFTKGSGCSSALGMRGGMQTIKLGSSCTTGNVIHEIGHAVGLLHEQSKVDRDDDIAIWKNNIKEGYEHNFETYDERGYEGEDYTEGVDFGSIMMYSSYAFSKNGRPTIVKKKDGKYYSFKTQRNGLSEKDIEGINKMYPGEQSNTVTYVTGQYYTINGLKVKYWAGKWLYWSKTRGWVYLVLKDGKWYYA
ncbi:M12 family metallopeptidase [Tenacibaculum xiamenense]|uniref:M12 family metallopeptidase n=1 Tax=Tenacibaculum xiamenense TaxID=1261553 RepID=UPI003893B7DC